MASDIKDLKTNIKRAKTDRERLKAMLDLVAVYCNQDFLDGWKLSNESLTLAAQLDDKNAIAKSHEGMANAAWKLAEYSLSLEHFADALHIYGLLNDLHGVARCYCGMGIICGSMEEYQTALEYFEEALATSKLAMRPELTASITGNIGHIYFNIGRYRDAMDCFHLGLNYYKDLKNNQGVANMLSGMAGVHVYLGEFQKGLELIRNSVDLHRRADHDRGVAVCMMNTGIALYKMGRLDEAEQELQKAWEFTHSIGLKSTEHDVLGHLVDVCRDLGRIEDLNRYLELQADGMREEKKASLKRKNEQLKQREEILRLQRRA